MKSHTLAAFDKPPLPIEALGAEQDENGLLRLPLYDEVADKARLLSGQFTQRELKISAPVYVSQGTEDGRLSAPAGQKIYDLFAKEMDIAQMASKAAITQADQQGWLEIERKAHRPIAITSTQKGRRYIHDHPELTNNVLFAISHIRRRRAENMWQELSEMNRALGEPVSVYMGEEITSLPGINRYIAELKQQQIYALEALDPEAALDLQ